MRSRLTAARTQGADDVEARAAGRRPGGEHLPPEDEGEEAERDVDPEERAPAGAERVELHQPARRRPGRRRARARSPAPSRPSPSRPAPGVNISRMRPKHCGHHRRGGQALEGAGDDEGVAGRRERAGDRGEHEADEPAEEHPPAPDDVAEPGGGDEADRERQGVRGGHPLEGRGGHREVGPDGRRGDVDDRAVEDVEDGRGEHDGEAEPGAARDGAARRARSAPAPRWSWSVRRRCRPVGRAGGGRHRRLLRVLRSTAVVVRGCRERR